MDKNETNISMADVNAWFEKEGFEKAAFAKNTEYITSHWLGQPVTFKLLKRAGFDTFYKEAFGGSLLVFEVSIRNHTLTYDCYCPILLFGIWTIKLTFKQHANGIFKYRREGYQIREKFEQFITNH